MPSSKGESKTLSMIFVRLGGCGNELLQRFIVTLNGCGCKFDFGILNRFKQRLNRI